MLFLLACISSKVEDSASSCLEEEGGYGDASLEETQAQCESEGGTGCDAAAWIQLDAAICLAEADGLDLGIGEDYTADLVYHAGWTRVVWGVSNLEYQETAEWGGSTRTIDATLGQVIESGGWLAME